MVLTSEGVKDDKTKRSIVELKHHSKGGSYYYCHGTFLAYLIIDF